MPEYWQKIRSITCYRKGGLFWFHWLGKDGSLYEKDFSSLARGVEWVRNHG